MLYSNWVHTAGTHLMDSSVCIPSAVRAEQVPKRVTALAERTVRLLLYSPPEMMHVSSYFQSCHAMMRKVKVVGWICEISGYPLTQSTMTLDIVKNPLCVYHNGEILHFHV